GVEKVVADLSRLTGINGEVELFDRFDAPLPTQAAQWLEKQTPNLCLGLRVQERLDGARAARAGWLWHVGLIRLSEPLYESPDEEVVNTSVLAHCRARLDFAAAYAAGCDVLEAGCAMGIGARLFAAHGARSVVGLDVTDDILDTA